MKKLCTILIASLSLMCSGFGLVYAQTPVCDEFDGSTINTAMWNPASGTWTQSGGRITGYWPLGSAHGEQGDLILTDAVQPTGNYTFEADMVNTSASGQGSPRINLYNSAGNKYTIVFESWSRGVTTALKQNSGSFQSLDPLGYYATNIDAFQTGAGVINTAKIVKHDSNQFTAYVNDVELFTIVDDVWNGDVNIGLGAYGYSTYERACFTSGGQVPGDLVAFWPMDETSGATVADMSGHHLDGTAGGTTIITGQVGNARSLNGTSDYIEVPDNDLLDLTDEITIMLWAKFDPTDAEGFLINKRLYSDAACEINYDIKYGFSGGNLYLAFQYGTGCATGNSYSLTNLTGMGDGAWHHLAVSLHFGDPSSAQWMIDGTARAGTWTKWNGTPGGGTDIPPTNSNALEMGRQLSSSPGYAKCSMDQVRLYGRALSVGEMQGVYSSEAGTQGPIPTILTLTCPVTSCRTGESVLFTATLTDDQGGPLAGKTINFNWSYSGLEPAENFAGSFSATTDLLGQCTLNWFSKWAAFTGNVTATISAVFTGDMIYSPCSDYAQLPVEFIEAQIHARIFKDLNGNGVWDPEAENLVPNIPMIVTSVYNDFEMVVSSSDGEYSIFVPKCAYQIKAVIEEEGNQQNLVDFINVTDFAIPGNVAVVNLPFVPLGIVRGTIYRDYYTQAGFPGASVSIFRASDHVELESIRSDENGNFSFRIPCGQVYGVWITADYNNSCLVRFEQASLVGCVEYAFGINLGLNDWWREWLYADHCMDAWVHAEPNIGTIQERECIYNATMGLMGLIPALCAVPVADDLCNFVESVGQSVAAGEPLSISDAAWQLDLIIVDMLGCMLAQPQFQSVLKHISIGAEVLKNWKNFENLAALLDLINAWQSCLNQITEMQQNLVTPSNAYHALAISGER